MQRNPLFLGKVWLRDRLDELGEVWRLRNALDLEERRTEVLMSGLVKVDTLGRVLSDREQRSQAHWLDIPLTLRSLSLDVQTSQDRPHVVASHIFASRNPLRP